MMIVAPINLISTDERGIAYIADTQMKVNQIVLEKNVWGLTPEEIRQGHEHLSLAQIYAALAYYYDHKAAIDTEIEQVRREVEILRAQNPNKFSRKEFELRRQHHQEPLL